MRFTKMQGCGNDYVYVNCFSETVADPNALARAIADRHFGVGGDGLILICPTETADARMRMFNADGSEGAMCGNGIRCVAKYIYDHGIIPADRRTAVIDTNDGPKTVEITAEDGKARLITVDMGVPRLTGTLPETITVRDMDLIFTGVDVGSQHAVYFLEDNPALRASDVRALDLAGFGPDFETHPRFPDRVNSEFIDVRSPGEIDFRVWERGSGETLACGTGATAAVWAGVRLGKLAPDVLVHLTGGDLRIRYDEAGGHCFMTGPAAEVFSGDFPWN